MQSVAIIAYLPIKCAALDNYLSSSIFTTGNFGVVNKAWYEQENVQIKVAIKTLKGKFISAVQ